LRLLTRASTHNECHVFLMFVYFVVFVVPGGRGI
jgi:hypothetical protein